MSIRFWIDGKEYTAPELWMERQIEARKALGADVQQAATEAMEAWSRNQKETNGNADTTAAF